MIYYSILISILILPKVYQNYLIFSNIFIEMPL